MFRADVPLRSKEFDVLIDYLKKTGSSVVLPQIILDEVRGLYKKALTDRILTLEKNVNNVNLLLIDSSEYIKTKAINIDQETNTYLEFVKKKLKIRNILPYNNSFLPIISQRAIDRKKTAGIDGQGFRDTLIWLTIKDYALNCQEKQITFISVNTDDFASSDKTQLHESLQTECDEIGIRINYFKTLKEFIENHSVKIDFITYDWIEKNLNYDAVSEAIMDFLNGSEKRSIITWIEYEINEECVGYKAINFESTADTNLSVYEMSDDRLIINLTMEGYSQFEFTIRSDGYWNDDYDYTDRTIEMSTDVIAEITITLIDKKIVDFEVHDFSI
ncbi:PIN domain-containing protein [Flavobacterium chungbukense]|uniref:PIN domain-containing protein n=1 Tax=Flavobacterium chungbukense TaxID=877464 RepID=UPI00293EECE7|nr:PIN domain-containing protein [Flavobacterium chungbukense]MCC4919916.1 PIN domain-containing protein [Flavobacterium chungbukense]